MVVDGEVDAVEAHAASPGPAGLPAQDLVAAAVGDPAELPDVDVDRFARPVPFVASDHFPCGPVQEGEAVQAVPE
ncbi:hypothetical protein HEP81_00093 [Streptomyces griseofuscus]|uniref:Uncharacterized protein n=1 Tax=Streptomyces griseofuscus TaxID=146922 RepID=A0A7H1PQV1_9ACTN|nr:hypothetical protein HEP81_00093 [Streptomyces griseofuscus]